MAAPDFSWDDLRVALAVGRTGSLTKAAQLLDIDQSTAGRRLSALEAQVGATLFVRSRSGLQPTQAGDAAIRRASDMAVRAEGLMQDVAQAADGVIGYVRLLGNPWTLALLGAGPAKRLLSANPKLQLRTVTMRPEVPRDGEASLSLWFDAAPRPPEFAIKLGNVPYALYTAAEGTASPGHWVAFYDENAPRRGPFHAYERLRKDGDRLVFTATDAGILASAIAGGVGQGLLPICLAARYPGLRRVADGAPEMTRELHLHLHPDTVQMRRVQAVIRWLREEFAVTFAALPETPRP